jgi:hypothetical protein
LLDRFIPKSFSHNIDLNLGSGYDAEALRYRKQAAQNTSQPIVNWRMRSTLNSACGNHLWWIQSRAEERSKQLTAHVDLESRARESLDNPVAALVKVLATWIAARQRHDHFLETTIPSGRRWRHSRRNVSAGFGKYIKISRPIMASRFLPTDMFPLPVNRDRCWRDVVAEFIPRAWLSSRLKIDDRRVDCSHPDIYSNEHI